MVCQTWRDTGPGHAPALPNNVRQEERIMALPLGTRDRRETCLFDGQPGFPSHNQIWNKIGYPSLERERDILLARIDGLPTDLADQASRIVHSIRALDLKKAPSISEALDWARTLLLIGKESVAPEDATGTLNILLKYEADIEKARRALLGLPSLEGEKPMPIDSYRRGDRAP